MNENMTNYKSPSIRYFLPLNKRTMKGEVGMKSLSYALQAGNNMNSNPKCFENVLLNSIAQMLKAIDHGPEFVRFQRKQCQLVSKLRTLKIV